MQGSDDKLDPNSELGRKYPQIVSYWNQRMADTVVPNIIRLLEYFRSIDSRVVYTRNGQITPNGAEVTARLRRWEPDPVGPSRYRGMPAHDIMPSIAAREDDLIVDMLTSGAFNASILDHALRNMGVRDFEQISPGDPNGFLFLKGFRIEDYTR